MSKFAILPFMAFALILTGAGCTFFDYSGDDSVESSSAIDSSEYDYEVPDGLTAVVDAPLRASVGESFPVVVTITNNTDEEQLLHSIDVAEAYIDGIAVISTSPVFTESFILGDGTVTHFFETPVPAGEVVTATFTMEALTPGDMRGDFDVCFAEGGTCAFLQIRTIVE
ncbi:hypothetical protein COV05_00985 [Candidatus Uhrbacteria bacterium CG10_big_fil_rev_8_21_14_0_10_48_16]|uniref:DUF11 domain-containing protein n=1 Tax=Candidatus Uhrbacteria bacterium CG10_big_fil_rev_8_21_14_0_10_48_16 TaxID=1975038 RepID=A0A2M8LI99_9BACT|nr:MAG: hypothetical protein COV05_00985 [Candidatus Uhrbacteria bacterium CG10_big_fil_rev_8_21_14_0_10_48_16]